MADYPRYFQAFENAQKFPSNAYNSQHYNWMTFLPLNLFEQFCKPINLYYLVIVTVELINDTHQVPSSLIPLVCLLILNMAKDLAEDRSLDRLDKEMNQRQARMVEENGVVNTLAWKDVRVGSIVIVHEDEAFPADVILLQTSESSSTCYVNTMELDGEINLKSKHSVPHSHKALTDYGVSDRAVPQVGLAHLQSIEVHCEDPNDNLTYFSGQVTSRDYKFDCSNKEIVYRGCTVRNTKWVLGIVVFTGQDTKLARNALVKKETKHSRVEHQLNRYFIGVVTSLLSLVLLAGLCYTVFITRNPNMWYTDNRDKKGFLGFLKQAVVYLTLMGSMMPISLTVSMGVIKFCHGHFINSDLELCSFEDEKGSVVRATARNTDIIEELGQVQYIFSDKTGTLTENRMVFIKCSIAGTAYGVGYTEVQLSEALRHGIVLGDPYPRDVDLPPDCNFYDPRISLGEWQMQESADHIRDFFLHLALCHTVITKARSGETTKTKTVAYSASSPDEEAMVVGASSIGFRFLGRRENAVTVEVEGKPLVYTVLNINEFTSSRKRMSCVVRDPTGRLLLLCKGADDVVLDRLMEHTSMVEETLDHLKMFAQQGLRTLVLAQRVLNESLYADWDLQFRSALKSPSETRVQELELVADQIEQKMTLLGATAVEDRLQAGVLECIPRLRRANIRIWMLSGDKVETCVNIAMAAGVLYLQMYIAEVTTVDVPGDVLLEGIWGDAQTENVIQRLATHLDASESDRNAGKDKALIVDGRAVQAALLDEEVSPAPGPFLQYALLCMAVVASRLTPLQKQSIVLMFKKKAQKVTLAVGDGANDVGMLRQAHIGVGIAGREGGQALLAADFTISRFALLEKLLLVHGRWALQRVSKLICYSFYKNIGHSLVVFWFGVACGFTGANLALEVVLGMWNVIFTAFPIIVYSLLERDLIYQETLIIIPELYRDSQDGQCFRPTVFVLWMLESFIYSLVAMVVFYSMQVNLLSNGLPLGLDVDQIVVQGMIHCLVTVRISLMTRTWTVINIVVYFSTMVVYGLFILVWSYLPHRFFDKLNLSQSVVGISKMISSSWVTWVGLTLYLVVSLLPFLIFRIVWWLYCRWDLTQQVKVWEAWMVREQGKIGRVFPGPQWKVALPLLLEREQQEMEGWASDSSPPVQAAASTADLRHYMGYGFAGESGQAPDVALSRT